MAVARFTLAVDRRFKRDNQPTADFISCICFRKTAEFLEKYCKKGTKLVVDGSWQTGSYTDFFEDERNGRFELTFRFKDESLSSCYYRFIKGKTPDFMGEDYIKQGKEQSESNYNFYNF